MNCTGKVLENPYTKYQPEYTNKTFMTYKLTTTNYPLLLLVLAFAMKSSTYKERHISDFTPLLTYMDHVSIQDL